MKATIHNGYESRQTSLLYVFAVILALTVHKPDYLDFETYWSN